MSCDGDDIHFLDPGFAMCFVRKVDKGEQMRCCEFKPELITKIESAGLTNL